jgi:hypothetical protein
VHGYVVQDNTGGRAGIHAKYPTYCIAEERISSMMLDRGGCRQPTSAARDVMFTARAASGSTVLRSARHSMPS